jgi:hypothetical protein
VHRDFRDVIIVAMLAVEAPVKKLVAVGGVALALAAGVAFTAHRAHASHHHHAHHRLTLHAPSEPGAIYFSIFNQGDVRWPSHRPLDLEADRTPLVFNWQVKTPDDCFWSVTETLTPTDARHFGYDYDEQPLGCAPDAVPSYIATPRTGVVVVDE